MGGAAFFAVDLEAGSLYNYVDGGIFFFDHGIRDSFVFDCLGHDQLSVIAAITVQPDAVIGRIDNRIYIQLSLIKDVSSSARAFSPITGISASMSIRARMMVRPCAAVCFNPFFFIIFSFSGSQSVFR